MEISVEQAVTMADKIGYPVMIKASEGGELLVHFNHFSCLIPRSLLVRDRWWKGYS